MTNEHPNVSILRRLNPRNLTQSADLFSEEFTWHFFNPKLPDVHGDYTGLPGLQGFFKKLSRITSGTFQVKPIAITAIGDELVVTHVKDRMTLENRAIELDAVVVWRIVNGKIAEAWDIPAIYTEQLQTA
ncbi:MAG: nuclear transport factor 2 family protein [Cyanobacteria bacterium P01_E01_bin.35]